MSLQINLSDRQFAALAASVVIILVLLGMVGAYNEPAGAGVPMIMGHSVDELNLSPLYIDWATGRVGIGTAGPDKILHIDAGDATEIAVEYDDTTTGWGGINFQDAANIKWQIGTLADSFTTASLQNAFFIYQFKDKADNAVSQYRLVIDDNGNVGIGTTGPASLNTRAPVLEIASGASTLPGLVLTSGHATYHDEWEIILSAGAVPDNGADFIIKQATTNLFTIQHDSGNVGIGTANPGCTLDLGGGTLCGQSDIIFEKDGTRLWRMFEDEDGLYLESVKTGKVYRFLLEEITDES